MPRLAVVGISPVVLSRTACGTPLCFAGGSYCWGLATISKLSLSNWEIMWHLERATFSTIKCGEKASKTMSDTVTTTIMFATNYAK